MARLYEGRFQVAAEVLRALGRCGIQTLKGRDILKEFQNYPPQTFLKTAGADMGCLEPGCERRAAVPPAGQGSLSGGITAPLALRWREAAGGGAAG